MHELFLKPSLNTLYSYFSQRFCRVLSHLRLLSSSNLIRDGTASYIRGLKIESFPRAEATISWEAPHQVQIVCQSLHIHINQTAPATATHTVHQRIKHCFYLFTSGGIILNQSPQFYLVNPRIEQYAVGDISFYRS